MNKVAKNFIKERVLEGIENSSQLTRSEKCALIPEIMRSLSSYDKPSILADADPGIFVKLVTNHIESEGSQETLNKLGKAIMDVFVDGYKGTPHYFKYSIDKQFRKFDHLLPNDRPANDEHLDDDNRQRLMDVQSELDKCKYGSAS